MRPTDTIRIDDAESRIPTWASRSSAVVGAILLAVTFMATTPAARIAIAAFNDSTVTRTVIDGAQEQVAETAPTEVEPTAREAAASAGPTWPRFIRLVGADGWSRGIDADTPSIGTPGTAGHRWESSRRIDRPNVTTDPSEHRSGRMLASRVFVGLFRHLESGLRHLTAPAFGSTTP